MTAKQLLVQMPVLASTLTEDPVQARCSRCHSNSRGAGRLITEQEEDSNGVGGLGLGWGKKGSNGAAWDFVQGWAIRELALNGAPSR